MTKTASESSTLASPGRVMDPRQFCYSIVIPVFNSAGIVGTTVDRVVETFEAAGLGYELILVNDGSSDGSWEVIAAKAREHAHVFAVDLLRNYGQHNANLAGLREATGDYVITMDDDMQNPPDQTLVLIEEAMTGRDVVFGKYVVKQHSGIRRLGSRAITWTNRRVFGQPADLPVSNFRILRRDVVDRICAYRTAFPYITGQALLCSSNRSHVLVRHEARPEGKSSYNVIRLLRLVLTILFSYSLFPLRAAALGGFIFAALSFLLGCVFLVRGLVFDSAVPGWTTVVVLLAIYNGVVITLLSMLGEYVVRTLRTVSAHETFHIKERVG